METTLPSLLILTGSMGSGKTAVLAEVSDILALRGIAHAAIDLDMLCLAHLPGGGVNEDVMYRNLKAVWQNFASFGVERLLLARAVETRAELEWCMKMVGIKPAIVCRLTASVATMQQRIAQRELGVCRDKYLERVIPLNSVLAEASLENFVIKNEGRALTDVAMEVLERAGWL